ncbi:MAG: LPP20 family lipoprotein [Deltaproteobacteria bacterium]|nr:LPP20 family lipoprotein [Deltaproteobacteria bacterium]
MKRLVAFWMMALGGMAFLLLACSGPSQEQREASDRRKAAGVRARSADAFADLNAVERGGPAAAPSKEIEEEPPPRKVEPPPEPEVKPYEEKAVASVPVNPARAAPDWVNSQPRMSGYYVGIGVATSHGDEEQDWARARNNAYTELASTLKVHINSVITDYFKENNLRLYDKDNVTKDASRQDSSYSQDSQFFVDQTLEGVEIHDRWKDEGAKKYWMLVRLSQAEIARRLRERLEKARKKAVDYVQAAFKAEQGNRLGEAFKGYFKSYLALREHFGGVVEYDVDGDGKKDVLNHEIERAVHRLAAAMEWKVANPNLKAVIGQGPAEPLELKIAYKGNAVGSLPVEYAFQRGEGSVEQHVSTSPEGVAKARLIKVYGEKKAILGARVDVSALIEGKQQVRVVQAKFENDLNLNTGKFFVELEELSAFVSIEEELLGEEVSPGSVAADLKDQLHKALGLTFTKSKSGADLEITGTAVVDACNDFFQQRQCTARVNVTVTDRLHSRQIFSKKYTVKGNGENDQEAGRDALSKVGKRIAKKVIEGMK